MSTRFRRHLLGGLLLATLPLSSYAFVSVGISVNVAPPPLPVYEQPPCPTVGYIWTPGYWAWDDGDYYWVPGTWIAPPSEGLLWTPGYWGWNEGAYLWHAGYWGPHVGFYGGVNYGYGYGGVGYEGGYWRGHSFYYNRSVTNVTNVNVTNVYNRTVVNNVTVNRVSYNGGSGGLSARPSGGELRAEHERHTEFTSAQREHEHTAAGNRELRASVNNGRPAIAATERANSFSGRGVVAARAAGGPVRSESHNAAERGNDARSNEFRGGSARPAENRGGPAGAASVRSDRPPGAAGSGTPSHDAHEQVRAQQHGGIAGSNERPGGNDRGAPARSNFGGGEARGNPAAEPRPQVREQPHSNPPGDRPHPQAQLQQRGNPGGAEPRGNPQPQARSEPRGNPQPQARSEPRGNPQPQVRSEPRGNPQPQARGEPRGQPQGHGGGDPRRSFRG
jgi:hypothetical protein